MTDPARAPILRDAARLHQWIHDKFEGDPRPACRHLCALTVHLVDHLLLALLDRDRARRLAEADDRLAVLRFHLRLLHERGVLQEGGLLHATAIADEVGRQLGGWRAKLPRVT